MDASGSAAVETDRGLRSPEDTPDRPTGGSAASTGRSGDGSGVRHQASSGVPSNPAGWTLPALSPPVAAVMVGLVAMVVFFNSLGNGFALDDVPIVLENEAIHDLSNLPDALAASYWGEETGQQSGIWRPVTTAVLGVQWALWGDNATPYHALNVVLHGGVSALATVFMAQLAPLGAALVGGLIFAVHPVHVEAVSNIVGVAELLAALFMLGACLLFVRGWSEEDGWRREDRRVDSSSTEAGIDRSGPKAGAIALILLLYALAFLTKESAAVLPALFILLDAWKGRLRVRDLPTYLRRRGGLLGLMALVGMGILWGRFQVLGSIATTVPPLGGDLLAEIPRIWTLPVIWLHYLRLLVFPADLSPDYTPGVIEIQLGWNPVNVAGVVAVLGLLGLAWVTWRDSGSPRSIALGVLWFLVTILPVANVVFLSEILLAERTLYTPSVGFALVVGALTWHLAARALPLTLAVLGLGLVLMVGRTWTATPIWDSTGSVMNHLLDEHPESGRVQWMWAELMMDQAEDPRAGLGAYRRALGVTGGTYAITDDAVEELLQMDAYEQAARISRLMWNARPEDPRAPARLAVALSNLGRTEELVEPARAALESRPNSSLLHHLAAVGYRERGEWTEAIRHRRQAIEHGEAGRWQQWRWLAELNLQAGDTAAALASLDSARARATDPELLAGLDSLRGSWSDPP